MTMLVVLIKSIITFLIALSVIRLMGKREIGEMKPFELVITLVIAEVACIPMNDPSIPFYSGVVPIVTLGIMHTIISFLSRKSLFFSVFVSGKSLIVVDKNGLNYKNIKKMNMNVGDLIEGIRSCGFFDLSQIAYAIMETNGSLSVIQKANITANDFLPRSLIIDGRIMANNLYLTGTTEQALTVRLKHNNVKKIHDVLICDIRQDGTIYVSTKFNGCFTDKLAITGGDSW